MKSRPIKIYCSKCTNCNGKECIKYGSDANKAVEACAKDGFKHYNTAHKMRNHAR